MPLWDPELLVTDALGILQLSDDTSAAVSEPVLRVKGMTSNSRTFDQWTAGAISLLERMGIPVVEADNSSLPAGGCRVDFLPKHDIEKGFKVLVDALKPELVVVWPSATDAGEVIEWNLHLFGSRDVIATCGEAEASGCEGTTSPDGAALGPVLSAGEDEYESDFEAFDVNMPELHPHLNPAVKLVLSLALDRGFEPEDPQIRTLFDSYTPQTPVDETVRRLLPSYLPYYGSHLIDDGIITARRAGFRTRATEYASEILASHSGLENLNKPLLMDIVWAHMKKHHGPRCASKSSVEPITDEVRRLRGQGQPKTS